MTLQDDLQKYYMPESFQMRQRILQSNIAGDVPILHSMRTIRGIGLCSAMKFLKQAGIDPSLKAGLLTPEMIQKLEDVCQACDIPEYYMNCRKIRKTGESCHKIGPALETHFRSNFDMQLRLKRHRVLRQRLGLKCKGQHTKTNNSGFQQHFGRTR
ncbi:MAG: hypothetical protein MHMPM18_002716 [Marteilia pararefringens]